MPFSDDPRSQLPSFNLGPETPFSYRCNACTRCCHHKIIPVSPYEIVRLSRRLGLTTTEFIAQHTTEGGTVLRRVPEEDAACVFLRPDGCSVHPDRPLVCRIYPLGVEVFPDGRLAYAQLEPHPETEGQYGTEGTTTSYAEQQGVPAMRAAIAPYRQIYHRMGEVLAALDASSEESIDEVGGAMMEMVDGVAISPLIDADTTVADYCARHALPVPRGVEETVALHVAAIDEMLDMIEAAHACQDDGEIGGRADGRHGYAKPQIDRG